MKHTKIKIGRYVVGGACTEIWLTTKHNSCAEAVWTKHGFGRVEVGCADATESQAIQALVHELGEMLLHARGHAFRRTQFMRLDDDCTSKFRFFFTHEDWSQISLELGDVLAFAVPELQKAYKKLKGNKG